METRRGLFLVLALVLLIRLPFLNQAVQGDDVYYLAEAQHAQIEPLHPNHFQYVFLGNPVDMRGHSHPPMNAWILAALLALFGDIREIPFHAAYIVFSLIAAGAMWSLARRFSPRPLWATLLFVAVPVFVINGNSLESDLPFLAFWMSAIALFVAGRYGWSAVAMVFAAMTAFQAVFLTPVLGVHAWLFARRQRGAWAAALTPVIVLACWQVFERATTGSLPASVLAGYFHAYGFQALSAKLRNAGMLAEHACWIVFPALLPGAAVLAWRKRREPETAFLLAWIALFFAGAVAVFFAGSARYLLPMAAPVALLASRLWPRWLAVGFAAQVAIGLALALVNYEHWDGYRKFAATLPPAKRMWINADWGLRFYLESAGGLPLRRGQAVRPGDLVVTSELAFPVKFTTGGGVLTPVAEREITPSLPLRIFGLNSRSGYSSSGYLPFDITSAPADRVRAELVVELKPTREYLRMSDPGAPNQIVSGLHELEGAWRWTTGKAIVLLKSPERPERLRAIFTIHGSAPARRLRLLIDGREVAAQTFPGPGAWKLESDPVQPESASATVTLEIDRTFRVPGDDRELGVILSEIGFVP